MQKIAFLDRDGTLIYEPPETGQIDSIALLKILPGVVEGLKKLKRQDYQLVLISNQDGMGTKRFPAADFKKPHDKFLQILKKEGIEFYKTFICPHFESDRCACRKPKTGLVSAWLLNGKIDPVRSFVLGDRQTDLEFAENLGIPGFKMLTNGSFPRLAFVERNTKETKIFAACNLDGSGNYSIDTGLNFFNHMLEQIAKHSLVDLVIKADGDLKVDEHHTVEDVGLVLGQLLSDALGPRKGIGRFGFSVPLDDALAEVAIDLGGRPYLVFSGAFKRPTVGDLPTELVSHFFRSVSDSLKANIHVNLKYGENEHHKIEAIFKAFAKALRLACALDPRTTDQSPSTKGVL